jgi:hypothetical protein
MTLYKKLNPPSLGARAGWVALAGMFNVPRKLISNRHSSKYPDFVAGCQCAEAGRLSGTLKLTLVTAVIYKLHAKE